MIFQLFYLTILFLNFVKPEKCIISNNIHCDCEIQKNNIKVIKNCSENEEWSTWTKWSKCREGIQKRRRKCTNFSNFFQKCNGDSIQKRKCEETTSNASKIPEFLFGTWTEWNIWSQCNCQSFLKHRTRFCQGISCEGCNKQFESCNSSECPTIKKWTSWTEWTNQDNSQIRFSSFCSSSNIKNIHVGTRSESRNITKGNWSEWNIQSGIVYRYRLNQGSNSKIEIEQHLISRRLSSSIPLYFVIPLCCFCLFLGFLIEYLISFIFSFFNYHFSRFCQPHHEPIEIEDYDRTNEVWCR